MLAAACGSATAAEVAYDSPMYADPAVEAPGFTEIFAPQLKPLWLQALGRPEADLQRQAIEAIADAHALGMEGLEESIPALIQIVQKPDAHPAVVQSAAKALVALDAQSAAPALEALLAGKSVDLAIIVEPALHKWSPDKLRDLRLKRLDDPATPRGLLLLTIRGLADAASDQAAPRLRELAVDTTVDSGVRLEAARSLGQLQTSGLEEDARKLASNKTPRAIPARLTAAALIARHQSDAALAILSQLANDSEPAVAAAALRGLIDQKSTLVIAIAEKSIGHADARLRQLSIEALQNHPTPERLQMFAARFEDVNADVRTTAREALLALAEEDRFRDPVRELAMKALASESWRSQEQGALLAGTLDHEPAVDRLTALLDSPWPEVFISSAWALRKISAPSSAPGIFAKLQREGLKIASLTIGKVDPNAPGPHLDGPVLIRRLDQQRSQLIQAMGDLRYAPADDLLRRCVARNNVIGIQTRISAIWALGHLHAGKPDAGLAGRLVGRLSDTAPPMPEDIRVRRMSAISLGRMQAKEGLDALKQFRTESSMAGAACVWAIREITGEEPPPPKPLVRQRRWFLEPITVSAEDPGDEAGP